MSQKKNPVSLIRSSAAEYLTFVAGSGNSDVNAVYADENIWLSQKMMGQLYDVEVNTINHHLKKLFDDSELEETSVIRNFRITAADGKSYDTKHYNLSAIIAVGYKVNSERTLRKIPMSMQDWETRLNRFLEATDREILQDAGKVTAEIAKTHAESEFEKYRVVQDRLYESDFNRMIGERRKSGGEG